MLPVLRRAHTLSFAEHDSMAEEDPVVHEIPVVLAHPSAAEHMAVLQYPLRPTHRPHALPSEARIKWENCMLELDHTHENMGVNMGLQQAAAENHSTNSTAHFDPDAPAQRSTDRLTLRSSKVPLHTHYALARLDAGTGEADSGDASTPVLRIVPVERLLQMRPSFSHIDRAEQQEKLRAQAREAAASAPSAAAAPAALAASEDADDTGADARVRHLHVQYRRKETERAVQAKLESHSHKVEVELMEPWSRLDVHAPDSEEAATTRGTLFGRTGDAGGSDAAAGDVAMQDAEAGDGESGDGVNCIWNMSKAAYLQSLSYRDLSSDAGAGDDIEHNEGLAMDSSAGMGKA